MRVQIRPAARLTRPLRVQGQSLALAAGAGVGRIDRQTDANTAAQPDLGWLEFIARRLGPQEVQRRMAHMAPGLLPFLLMVIPHEDPVSPTLMAIMIASTVVIAAWIWIRHPQIVREGEQSITGAILGYAGVVLGMLMLFPASPELGMAVMGILAFGDGSATLAGMALGRRPLPWNGEKTWIGLTAFVGAALPMAALILWGESQPGIPVLTALACAAPPTLAAAFAETLPMRLNDNIRVGLAAAMTIILAHGMFVG